MKAPLPSLPPELISHIANFLLDDDVVDYISFRAVCREWRSCTASPWGLDSRFRPRRWIMLSEGDDAKLDTSHRRRFLNVCTGRVLVLHLPELATFSVFSDSDGLLFLIDRSTHAVRLFNPFTRHLAHLPNYTYRGRGAELCAWKRHSNTSISTGSCPTVMVLNSRAVYFAKPGDSCWNVFRFQGVCPTSMLCFRDQFYFASPRSGIQSFHFQERSLRPLIPPLNANIIRGISERCYIAEFNKEMLLLHKKRQTLGGPEFSYMSLYSVYIVDLESNRLVPMFDNRDLAIFLGNGRRCFAFSLNGLPSIQPNSVYYCQGEGIMNRFCRIGLYNMNEEIESSSDVFIFDGLRLGYLFRPITLPQYLAAYCLSSY